MVSPKYFEGNLYSNKSWDRLVLLASIVNLLLNNDFLVHTSSQKSLNYDLKAEKGVVKRGKCKGWNEGWSISCMTCKWKILLLLKGNVSLSPFFSESLSHNIWLESLIMSSKSWVIDATILPVYALNFFELFWILNL